MGWACSFAADPDLVFSSTSDVTGRLPGLVCVRLEEPLQGSSVTKWNGWYKVARLIEEFPF